MKEFIKKALKSYALGKMIYPFIQRSYQMVALPLKRRRLQSYGGVVLHRLHTLLSNAKIDYYADWGSLLGIVREGGFIRHDDDIDLTIVDKNVNPRLLLKLLLEHEFHFIHAIEIDKRLVEFSVSWKKLSIDFFFRIPVEQDGMVGICDVYYNPNIQYENPNQNNYRVWYFAEEVSTKIIDFKGGDVRIPENPESILEFEYGSDWRSPISGWVSNELKGRFKEKDGYAIRITNLKEVFV